MNYEKAFERAKSAYGTGAYDDATLEFLFPELRESEDEKIRKFLLRLAKRCNENSIDFLGEIKKKDVIAYLEKQKINTEGDFGRGYDCGYEACLNSHGAEWFEKQKEQKPVKVGENAYFDSNTDMWFIKKEQKPAEWSEEDELMRTAVIQTLKMFDGRGTTDMQIDWLKSLRPSWKPSEEQMEALLNTLHPDDPYYCDLQSLYNDLKKLM